MPPSFRPWVAECPPEDSPGIRADEALVGPLRGSRNASGFRCVYPHKWGYRGVIKWGGGEVRENGRRVGGGRLRHWPTVALPQQAAAMVAKWLRLRLGPDWALLVRRHPRNLWRRYAPFRVRRHPRYDGWILTVWVDGVPREVGAGDAHKVFASWGDAADFVPRWMKETFGRRWWSRLWR